MNRVLYILFGIMFLFTACEDIIDPTLEDAEPVIVFDAWISDTPGPQEIRIMLSQPYFDNTLPPGVQGATVQVTDNLGVVYDFVEDLTEPGVYRWTPALQDETLGHVGRTYTLSALVAGETFESTTTMSRTTPIDSITFTFDEGNAFMEDSYIAEVWARDSIGSGDAYWIKAWKNGGLLSKPSEINLAYDAGFSSGGEFDGVYFIYPIRTGINPYDQDENDVFLSPYMPGDSVYVEIHSLSDAAFSFLSQVIIQTNRPGGFGELFATPLANVSTNVVNTNSNGTPAVGFFNVASVSGFGKKFVE